MELRGSLTELVGRAWHRVGVGVPRSVKDLIESVGVPHTEVAAITVDAVPVHLDHRIGGGEQVVVLPPGHAEVSRLLPSLLPPPPEPRRFVLDVHLGTLSRRLRLLGFDCWYRTEAPDRVLAGVAVAERRILLTRDRQLLMRREIVHGYCPRSDDPDRQLAEVVARFGLQHRASPLTRCTACNGRLEAVAKDRIAAAIPARTREAIDRYARCTACGKVYWPGSHLAPITEILRRAGVELSR